MQRLGKSVQEYRSVVISFLLHHRHNLRLHLLYGRHHLLNCTRSSQELMKSCFPNPQHHDHSATLIHRQTTTTTTISSLPDDLLLECLSRVPHSSFPSISVVCRRWSHLLHSSAFHHLRCLHNRLSLSVFALSLSPSGLHASTHRFILDTPWTKTTYLVPNAAIPFAPGYFSHARLVAIGPKIYIISRTAMLSYDTWTGNIVPKPGMLNARRKFAAAVVGGKIYICGGACRTAAVDEFDPYSETWRVVASAPRKRYGCIGASVDGIFYVIGGLKIGACTLRAISGAEAHTYTSTMDLYDVETRGWLRSRAVPDGGCVVAACGAAGYLYVLASHAVELSFWRFNGSKTNGRFGEWCRIKGPPLPAQARLDSTVRFSCVGVGDKVILVQVMGCIDDLLRRGGRSTRGLKKGLVLVYNPAVGEWSRGADLPEVIPRAACVSVEC